MNVSFLSFKGYGGSSGGGGGYGGGGSGGGGTKLFEFAIKIE